MTSEEAIRGILRNDPAQVKAFYLECRRHFMSYGEQLHLPVKSARERSDLFHESFMKLWTEVRSGDIFTEGGEVWKRGKKGEVKKMAVPLTRYLMGIVKYRHLELLRAEEMFSDMEEDAEKEGNGLQPPEPEITTEQILVKKVGEMPKSCREILTLFYVRRLSLDEIMSIRSEHQRKDGLKTAKSKCLSKLKQEILKELEKLQMKP